MTDFAFRNLLPEALDTGRLLLRAPAEDDVPDIARLANNSKIHAMLARLPHPYTLADAKNFVGTIARSTTEHVWAVHTRDENFIGMIGLHFAPGKLPHLGYWLGEPYWGEGFASEAVAAIVAACDAAGCTALGARALAVNKASIAILSKSGFVIADEIIDDCGPHKGVSVVSLRRERST